MRFSHSRDGGQVHVDKTCSLYEMVDSGTYYFLSRSPREDTQPLVSTLKSLFEGRKDLFEGLWVEEMWHWRPYPVLQFSMNATAYNDVGLEKALHQRIEEIAQEHEVSLSGMGLGVRFAELIEKVAKGAPSSPAVVLIDHCDEPMNVNHKKAEENREIFKTFYCGVKDCDEWLQFFFMTGVSPYYKVMSFSDLNNLYDISDDPRFDVLTGVRDDRGMTSSN